MTHGNFLSQNHVILREPSRVPTIDKDPETLEDAIQRAKEAPLSQAKGERLQQISQTEEELYALRGPLASLNGISVNLAELFLKLQGLFLNVFRTIPKICIYIYKYTLI